MNQNDIPTRELLPGISVISTTNGKKVIYKWFHGVGGAVNKTIEVLLFLLGIIVSVFTLNGVVKVFTSGSNFSQGIIVIFLFICGLIMVYRGLTIFFNHTSFEVSSESLAIRHGPLPGSANLDLPRFDITGAEWRKISQSRSSGNSGTRLSAGYSATFDVVVTTTSGKAITLISGIHARDYAFALSSTLTELLK